MRDIFKFLFMLRYVKQCKLKITVRDIFLIASFYHAFKIKRWKTWKEYYIMVIDHSIANVIDFEKSSRDVAYLIIEEKLMETQNGQ